MLKNLLLSLLLLPTLIMAQNPPPAGNWLESLFAEQHWDLRLEIKLIDIRNYVSKVTAPAMGCIRNRICGHLSTVVFGSFENGRMLELEEVNSVFSENFLGVEKISDAPELLTRIIDKRVVQISYNNTEQVIEFLRNNIGRGDHVALTLKVINRPRIGFHVFNVANLDGQFVAIDAAQKINGRILSRPLSDVLRNKRIGLLGITGDSKYTIDFVLRNNRNYVFPATGEQVPGALRESNNGRVIHIAGTYDSNTIVRSLDTSNACPRDDFSINLPHL